MKNSKFIALIALAASPAFADLVALDDQELQAATGEGLGFALEDFALVSRGDEGSTLKVTGIDDSNGGEIDINWTELYILGEGSNKGQNTDSKAQIGSYLHPWVIRSARGSKGLAVGHRDYNEDYTGIGNDVALLEFATDSYSSNLQNTNLYSDFARYQDCVYGQPGCTDLGYVNGDSLAERKAQAELNALLADQAAIQGRYAGGTTLTQLENGRDLAYGNVNDANSIAYQEKVVEDQFDRMSDFKGIAQTQYGLMSESERQETAPFFRPECATSIWIACTSREDAYDEALVEYFDELVILEEERTVLEERELDDTRTGLGQNYLVVITDIDRQKALCGFDDNLSTCEDGAISSQRDTVTNVETIAMNLSSGMRQRPGLDIGATFEFTLNRADGSTRNDFLDIDIRGLYIDGSSFKLWSRPSRENAAQNELNAELRLNIFAKEIDIRACNDNECVNEAQREAATLNIDNFFVNLNLGYGDVQPLRLSATSDGNFEFLLDKLDPTDPIANSQGLSAEEFYQDYYANSPKSNVSIGDVRIGTNNSLGGLRITGLRAQYLKVTSQDL